MKTKFTSLFIVVLGILLSTCKDKEPVWRNYGPYYMGQMRDYVYFKKGTWWVYENTVTKERDSMVLQWVTLDTFTYTDNYNGESDNKIIKERLNYLVHSITTGYKYEHYMETPSVWSGMPDRNYGTFYLIRDKYKPGDYAGWDVSFIYPYEIGHNWDATIISSDTFLTINGKRYNDVVHLEIWEYKELTPKIQYYWAKNYGLVYFEVRNNQVAEKKEYWQLVNANIVQ